MGKKTQGKGWEGGGGSFWLVMVECTVGDHHVDGAGRRWGVRGDGKGRAGW